MITKSSLRFLDIYLLVDLSVSEAEIINYINLKMEASFDFIKEHQSKGYCDSTIRFFNSRPEDNNYLEEHFGKFIWTPISHRRKYANINHQLQLVFSKHSELKKAHLPAAIDNSIILLLTDKIDDNILFEHDTFKLNKYLFYIGEPTQNEIISLNKFTNKSSNIIYTTSKILIVDLLMVYLETIVKNMTNIVESSTLGTVLETRIALLEKLNQITGFKRGEIPITKFANIELVDFELAFLRFLLDSETKKVHKEIFDNSDLELAIDIFFKNNTSFNPALKNSFDKTTYNEFKNLFEKKGVFDFELDDEIKQFFKIPDDVEWEEI